MTVRNFANGQISVQVLTLLMRHHPGGEGHGSRWDCSCVVQVHGKEATVSGMAGKFTVAARRHIKAALLALGITSVRWERYNKGVVRHYVVHAKESPPKRA